MRLKDKVAIVTGSGKGLGRAMVVAMAKEGAKVVIAEVDGEALEDAAKEIKAMGCEYVAVKTDVAVKADVEQMVEKAISAFGRVDILVNNAGGSFRKPYSIEELKEEDWNLVVDINLKGTFFCCQAVMPYMKKQKSGAIVNISSMAARATMFPTGASFSNLAYAAAKGGVIGLTKKLAFDVGPLGVRVNAIAPYINQGGTNMRALWMEKTEEVRQQYLTEIPLRRIGSADDIVGAVMFLVTEESAYVTGYTLDVSGGVYSA